MPPASAPEDSPAPRPAPILAGSALHCLSVGALYGWSLFYRPIEAELGIGRAWLSAVFALASLVFTLCMVAAPFFCAGWKAGRVALLAGALAGSGTALPGLVGELWALFLGYGVLYGAACGFGYSAAIQSAVLAWRRRQGLAAGICAGAGAVGSVAAALLFARGIEAMGPWRTFVAAGAAYLAFGLLAAVLMRRVDMPRPARRRDGAPAPAAGETALMLRLWCGFFFGACAGLMTLGHAAGIAAAYGAAVSGAALATALVTGGNGAGRIVCGWLADALPVRAVLAGAALLAAAGLFGLALFPSLGAAFVAVAAIGLAYGGMAATYPAATARYFGAERMGVVFGRVFTAWGAAGFVAPAVAGALFDLTGGYRLAVLLAGGAALLSAAAAATLPAAAAYSAARPSVAGAGTS
jgi:MFS family permease